MCLKIQISREVLALLLLVSCAIVTPISGSWASSDERQPKAPIQRSLAALLASPQQYDRVRVRTIGFAVLEFEHSVLYLSEHDAENLIVTNAVWLDLPPSTPGQKERNSHVYVLVEATYDALDHGHLSGYVGTLKNVTLIEQWSTKNSTKDSSEQ